MRRHACAITARRIWAVAPVALLMAAQAFAMSAEEAYRAIPHRRTVFDVSSATMSAGERAYLTRLFALVDLAIVERVERLRWLQAGARAAAPTDDYNTLLGQLAALEPPARLATVHRLVVDAVIAQRAALEEWRRAGQVPDVQRHPLVGAASQKLHAAYEELMQLYPQEGPRNRDAFFDYLCALDFI